MTIVTITLLHNEKHSAQVRYSSLSCLDDMRISYVVIHAFDVYLPVSNNYTVYSRLPVPWLLHGAIRGIPYTVSSEGLFCSIVLLFIMLIMVIVLIAAFRWKMNKAMGFAMLGLYCIFLAIALLLEFRIIQCPLS